MISTSRGKLSLEAPASSTSTAPQYGRTFSLIFLSDLADEMATRFVVTGFSVGCEQFISVLLMTWTRLYRHGVNLQDRGKKMEGF